MYRRFIRPKPVKKNCPYCKGEAGPDYKEPEKLRAFISERGRILGRLRTGICTKHQRHLTLAIKRARHLAYLPFVAGV